MRRAAEERSGAGPPPGRVPRHQPPPRHPPPQARHVDRDVPSAVGEVLARLLDERLDQSARLDPVFARDVAACVARFTLDGGKRLRSQFLWWAMRACDGPAAAVVPALRIAAALELLQTCALVHDDLMDGSALRRGRPAVHTALRDRYGPGPRHEGADFGTSSAVLVGDLALAWADDVLLDTELPPGSHERVRTEWRALRTELVAGQYLDLHGQVTGSRSRAQALHVTRLKSALYTVERPLALGAALAGADEDTTRALCTAGRYAGIAFQLRDDLSGVFGDPTETGKPSGEDIREGKPTYLTAVGRARAETGGDRAALAVLDAAIGAPDLTADDLRRVRTALIMTGARDAVADRADHFAALALRHLEAVPRSSAPEALRRLARLLEETAHGRRAPSRARGVLPS
ncbi:polyprenyl synthetase family protein [Streptomyces sp. NPDC049906]|uniref:polyprenyl synthetase family protein n=1 Tax=Streptomyces sp. NPDC049906 TaxID=3155656 RepID=UPI003449809B